MTDAAQQTLRLPVDDSPPPERLGRNLLLAVGAIVLVLHLALVTVFTPLEPEPAENGDRTDRSALFVSSRIAAESPDFMKAVDTYDPIAFLHPPEDVGFSFFRAKREDFSLDAPVEPVLPPRAPADLEPLPPFEAAPVVRALIRDAAAADAAADREAMPVSGLSYPYCVADSMPDVKFPAFSTDTQTERILRRSTPSRPSVFELRRTPDVISDPDPDDAGLYLFAGSDPRCEAILTESCGVVELDLAARAWLDTFLNSQDAPETVRPGDRCRIVWSAKAIGKEPSVR